MKTAEILVSVFRVPFSDIVKRKRIRPRAGWDESFQGLAKRGLPLRVEGREAA